MYMTRIFLKRQPVANVTHGIISSAFPHKRNEKANENLWRIDDIGENIILLIVSSNNPDLQFIEDKIGLPGHKSSSEDNGNKLNKTVNYAPFLGKLDIGQVWNFRLCANPVKHEKLENDDKRGKVRALYKKDDQIAWIERQSEKNGFSIKDCKIIADYKINFDDIKILSVTFDGTLIITDVNIFRNALTKGIGRGKAYGCGLLTIAKANI